MGQQDQPPTPDNAPHASDDGVTRDQRIAAMRELAGGVSASAINTPSRRGHTRLAVLITALVVVVALIAAVAAQGLFPWQRHAQPASNVTSINLAANNLFCPSYAAWSPDGTRIAVLAQTNTCGNVDAGVVSPSVVALFDEHGHLIRNFDVDAAIPGITHTAGSQATPDISALSLVYPQYEGLLWSTDGARLALPFGLTHVVNGEPGAVDYGVALISADGSTTTSLISAPFYGYDYWDIQTKQVIHRNSQDVQLALGYRWSDDGKLVAAPVPPTSAPVGSPSGGQSFTIWQPGTVMLDRTTSTLNFGTTVAAWSPDGRYLMPMVGFGGELDPNAIGYTQGSDGQFHLAPRDKGLMAAAVRLKDPADPYATQISVVWRADGKLIAATDPNPLIDQVVANGDTEDIPDASRNITVFDCATGMRLLTLKTRPLANHQSNYAGLVPQPALGWNPTGDKLFFLDTTFDALTIWNVNLR